MEELEEVGDFVSFEVGAAEEFVEVLEAFFAEAEGFHQ